ncbi:acetyltransferase [Photobacterium leiognathi subsp. mandapamensis]|uniref:acyltransferase n=1 Tax=Photobacterium leiognathi TaxID=553611 RepID=UPI000D16740B|nr:acyltransferase [Photobacterium leiognathi]PSU95984.1 acetyltransferase [Photobacterium leiognathi subsp. mandapamensis]
MNGRDFFSKFRFVINLVSSFFSILPNKVLLIIYEFISLIPTKVGVAFRYIILKAMVPSLGDNVYIGRYVVFKNIENFIIGNNVSIHDFCYIDAKGKIIIEDNVSIAHSCSIISFEHGYSDVNIPIKYNPLILKPIVIKSDVWVGAGVRILSGAEIESRCIIAASSVVKGHVKGKSVFAGVPARFIKDIS